MRRVHRAGLRCTLNRWTLDPLAGSWVSGLRPRLPRERPAFPTRRYWEVAEEGDDKQPYRIEFVGVTCDAGLAVCPPSPSWIVGSGFMLCTLQALCRAATQQHVQSLLHVLAASMGLSALRTGRAMCGLPSGRGSHTLTLRPWLYTLKHLSALAAGLLQPMAACTQAQQHRPTRCRSAWEHADQHTPVARRWRAASGGAFARGAPCRWSPSCAATACSARTGPAWRTAWTWPPCTTQVPPPDY